MIVVVAAAVAVVVVVAAAAGLEENGVRRNYPIELKERQFFFSIISHRTSHLRQSNIVPGSPSRKPMSDISYSARLAP
jgi:hypothetical protein